MFHRKTFNLTDDWICIHVISWLRFRAEIFSTSYVRSCKSNRKSKKGTFHTSLFKNDSFVFYMKHSIDLSPTFTHLFCQFQWISNTFYVYDIVIKYNTSLKEMAFLSKTNFCASQITYIHSISIELKILKIDWKNEM